MREELRIEVGAGLPYSDDGGGGGFSVFFEGFSYRYEGGIFFVILPGLKSEVAADHADALTNGYPAY